jgi:hypothetical protein
LLLKLKQDHFLPRMQPEFAQQFSRTGTVCAGHLHDLARNVFTLAVVVHWCAF